MNINCLPTLILGVLSSVLPLHAANVYVAQTAQGSDTGADAADAHSAVWFNTSSNWGAGAGTIRAGDTVHLVGTISTVLTVQASGSAGSVITILFESGAKLSQAAHTLMSAANQSYLVIDGGANGIIENTGNGTSLPNQVATCGILGNGMSNVEIKNLTFQNLYVHASGDAAGPDLTTVAAIYMNGLGDNILIHDNTFHDVCWCITALGSRSTNFQVYGNYFYSFDHGIAGLGGITGLLVHDNHFGTTANWDTPTNSWHHDGVHAFFGSGISLNGAKFYNNLFDGDWGVNNTAHMFFEGDVISHTGTINGTVIYNNVHVAYTGRLLNNGFLNGSGDSWLVANNTYVGAGTTLSVAMTLGGTNWTISNNIFTACNTFIYVPGTITFATGGLNHNIYFNQAPGGNSPWYLNAVAYNTMSAWRTATGQEAASVTTNPLLSSSYMLQSGSSAIAAGANFSAFFTTDKAGSTRPATGAWDIGAYVYGGSPVVTAPSNAKAAVTVQ